MARPRMLVLLAACVSAVLVAPAGGVAAEEGAATRVDTLAATASASAVQVSGTATFVDVPAEIAFDSTGDSLEPGTGADVAGGTLSRPAGTNNLVFTLQVADQPPVVNGTPGILYLWPVAADGTDTGLFLMAGRMGLGTTDPSFVLGRNDGDSFSDVATLQGRMEEGVVEWTVPMSRIGARPDGGFVGQGGLNNTPVGTINGWPSLFWCCFILDGFVVDDYQIPVAAVELGIAPAGTPPDAVPLTETGTVDAKTGSFTGSLDTSALSPGEYVVVAEACYGAGNCGMGSTTVTVSAP